MTMKNIAGTILEYNKIQTKNRISSNGNPKKLIPKVYFLLNPHTPILVKYESHKINAVEIIKFEIKKEIKCL